MALGDGVEGWRVERYGPVFSTWEIVHELPGRIRFRNRLIRRDAVRFAAIDAALAGRRDGDEAKIEEHLVRKRGDSSFHDHKVTL